MYYEAYDTRERSSAAREAVFKEKTATREEHVNACD